MKKVLLVILDGWGIAEDPEVSAIHAAHTPFYDAIIQEWPFTQLEASGTAVGLPEGQMGNSEVGHMNIGAGRIVLQDLLRISKALDHLDQNPVFQSLLSYIQTYKVPLHLLGLVSDGGVHSALTHLKKLLVKLKENGIHHVYIHAFTDGRDTDPHSGLGFINELHHFLNQLGIGAIASIVGRYYAMDRDKRWERIQEAYHLLVHGKGKTFHNPLEAVKDAYNEGITDEFIKPRVIVNEKGDPISTIKDGDAVLFFNFRADRARQLTYVLTQQSFPEYSMQPLSLHFVTFTEYDPTYHLPFLFDKPHIDEGLGEVLSKRGLTQLRIAETEKYPHVTYFFNGGREEPFPNEQRILIPSPKVATYDLKPEMSAIEVTNAAIDFLTTHHPDFICLNYANPDMVGHTGVWEAAVKACETVDACNQRLVTTALKHHYICIVTADHGNADKMKNPDGSPHTAHTLAKVPFVILGEDVKELVLKQEGGVLGNIAPTILELMGLPPSPSMECDSLIQPKKRAYAK